MAGDCAVGRISRAQMLKATEAGNARLAEIGAELDTAARENVLAPADGRRERRHNLGGTG